MLRRADPSPRAGGDALARARGNVTVWKKEAEQGGLDAILITASGCGTVIKDYGFMLREDRDCRPPRANLRAGKGYHRISRRLCSCHRSQKGDVTVAYHSACSLQHGQKITGASERIAFQEWIRGERYARKPFVLRFGGDLQYSPARHCGKIARSEDRQHRNSEAGHDRCGQYRVHGSDCRRHVNSGGAHSRASRLGDRRSKAWIDRSGIERPGSTLINGTDAMRTKTIRSARPAQTSTDMTSGNRRTTMAKRRRARRPRRPKRPRRP